MPRKPRLPFLRLSLFSCLLCLAKHGQTLEAQPGPDVTAIHGKSPGALLAKLRSPILFRGDESTAFRDPLLIHDGQSFRLFFSLATRDAAGVTAWQTAWARSTDLEHWTAPIAITPRDPTLNFCSPGSLLRQGNEWVLALQTYPTPKGEKFGNDSSRLWTMRSTDLERWSAPELIAFFGPEVTREQMPRMIDPCIVPDKDEAGKWWCFAKVKGSGVSMSSSRDLHTWHHEGQIGGGENPGLIVENGDYVMFYSPANGIGVKRSPDLRHWRDERVLTLGQSTWPWAKGRITAGYVFDARAIAGVGRYLMVFHGSGPEDEGTMFSTHASIGIAWSEDLKRWSWPGATPMP